MSFPLPTGQVAAMLGTTEPKLAEVVRRGHVHPRPTVLAGRRLWTPEHVRQAAAHLGLLTPSLQRTLDATDTERSDA